MREPELGLTRPGVPGSWGSSTRPAGCRADSGATGSSPSLEDPALGTRVTPRTGNWAAYHAWHRAEPGRPDGSLLSGHGGEASPRERVATPALPSCRRLQGTAEPQSCHHALTPDDRVPQEHTDCAAK